MLRRLLIASTIVAVAVPAFAQETMRVRGTIEKVDGSTLMVKARDGADLKIAVVGDKPVYTALEKASLTDIKPGTYIGVTSLPQADGSLKAVAVLAVGHADPDKARTRAPRLSAATAITAL